MSCCSFLLDLLRFLLILVLFPFLLVHAIYRTKCAKKKPFPVELEDAAMAKKVRGNHATFI